MMRVRRAQEIDLPALTTLFRQTILVNAPQHYTSAQVKTWAAFSEDLDHFRQLILKVTTYVVEDETGILGFAGISGNGHVASAYVRQDRIHQGVGSLLMETLLKHASDNSMQRLYGEASEFSLGLFKKFGFRLYDTEVVNRQGVTFKRYLIEKTMTDLRS